MKINEKDMKNWLKDKGQPTEAPEGETDEEKALIKAAKTWGFEHRVINKPKTK